METENLKLGYTILCDDVRLEAGNKLSLMGIFQNILVERAPVSLIKFAIVQHWRGSGNYLAEVRVLSTDKSQVLMASQPAQVALGENGVADNVSFFVNAVFPEAGVYWVQTLIDSSLYNEFSLTISEMKLSSEASGGDEFPDIVQ